MRSVTGSLVGTEPLHQPLFGGPAQVGRRVGRLLRGSSQLLVASALAAAVLGTGARLSLLPVVAWSWRNALVELARIVRRGLGSGLTAWTGAWRGAGHCECCSEWVRGKDGELILAKLTAAADGRQKLAPRVRERSGLRFSRACFVVADGKVACSFLLKHTTSCDGALRTEETALRRESGVSRARRSKEWFRFQGLHKLLNGLGSHLTCLASAALPCSNFRVFYSDVMILGPMPDSVANASSRPTMAISMLVPNPSLANIHCQLQIHAKLPPMPHVHGPRSTVHVIPRLSLIRGTQALPRRPRFAGLIKSSNLASLQLALAG